MKAVELLRKIDELLHEAENLPSSSDEEFNDALRLINNALTTWAMFYGVKSRYWSFTVKRDSETGNFYLIAEPRFKLKVPLLSHPETEPKNPVVLDE